MPFSSKKQQRYLESDASPLTEGQKREFEAATDSKKLPAKVRKTPHSGFRSVERAAKRIKL